MMIVLPSIAIMIAVLFSFGYPLIKGGTFFTGVNVVFLDHNMNVFNNYTHHSEEVWPIYRYVYNKVFPNHGVNNTILDPDKLFKGLGVNLVNSSN